MAIDFEKIRTDNIREYGEGTRHLAFLGRLYPDRTHFIYELLQNAEDVKATSVKFLLHPDRLEFEHNGRPFNEADVRGICGVGEGTKAEDLNLIGKFGIGFKSVYAVTNSPEVHSGNDHFRIKNFVRPYECEEKTPAKGQDTLFIFPFDRKDVEASLALDEMQDSLKNMPTHTILFLRHIQKIQIKINGDDCLTLSKQIAASHSCGVREVVLTNGKHNQDRFLLFSKPIPNVDQKLSVEISYQILPDGTLAKPWNTSLVVFFPTDKQTNLGFVIQGPYRTTPARDSIPVKDEFNRQLIELTADLMVESLLWLRDKNYLDDKAYDLLPIDENCFQAGTMFRPFYDKLLTAFSDHELLITSKKTPTRSSMYCTKNTIAIARGSELRQLIDNDMLLYLTQGRVKHWLHGAITEQRQTLYRYLRDELEIEEWRPDDLIKKLDTPFISQRDDEWLIKLYKLIHTQRQWMSVIHSRKQQPKSEYEYRIPFLTKDIIRLQDGSHVKPFKELNCLEPSAYLSSDETSDFPIVKLSLIQEPESRAFFEVLGYSEPSEIEYVIENILPKLNKKDFAIAPQEELIDTARKIIQSWSEANKQQRSIIKNKINSTKWLPALSFSIPADTLLARHKSCYLLSGETQLFFEGSTQHFYLCPELTDLAESLVEMGVKDKINVKSKTPDSWGYVSITYSYGWHKRGLNCFDPDAEVEGLHFALEKTVSDHKVERAGFIWNRLLIPNKHLIRGIIESATHQNYDNSKKTTDYSILGKEVTSVAWVPDTNGVFRKPGEMTLVDLPNRFIRDRELAEMLGMKVAEEDPIAEIVKKYGIPGVILEKLKERPDLLPLITETLLKILGQADQKSTPHSDASKTNPEFPKHEIRDFNRRTESVSEGIHKASNKTYQTKDRMVRTSKDDEKIDTYLKHFYTNSNEEMVCQLCKKVMPFKKRNGEYYFEAVELLTKELIRKESESMYLALCPTCAAKYMEYIKRDSTKIHTMVKLIQCSEIEEIAIETDRPETLRFNPPHYLDVRTIVTELIDPDD